MNVIQVRRTGTILNPDRTRVLIRPFNFTGEQRAVNICARVMTLSEEEVRVQLEQVLSEFGERHLQIRELLRARYERMKKYLLTNHKVSEARSLLIGAYFTHEYALEAAALFNPSIVPHPDQSDVPAGALRFILSLRATGEGHISSVTFRTGIVDGNQKITLNPPTQTNGIEDARFVRFEKEDGAKVYYATYTAYDGKLILPQLLETPNFLHFKFSTLNGPAVQNKGMALFPRKINGLYAMLSRQDNENIYLMYSDNIDFWYSRELIMKPTYPWEFVQLGNCGSPTETEAGWLVLSHGVGTMRKY